ncbi:hypothetical protein ACFLWN_04240 [Chloroflexota bacterium]
MSPNDSTAKCVAGNAACQGEREKLRKSLPREGKMRFPVTTQKVLMGCNRNKQSVVFPPGAEMVPTPREQWLVCKHCGGDFIVGAGGTLECNKCGHVTGDISLLFEKIPPDRLRAAADCNNLIPADTRRTH